MTDTSAITSGIDFNRFLEASVSNAVFNIEADMQLLIRGPSLHFYIKNGSGAVLEYSFNGTTLHGRLIASEQRLYSFRRVSKIWFRSPGSTTVEVEAWATA